MPSTPLSPSVPPRVNEKPEQAKDIVSAYKTLLQLEKTILTGINSAASKQEAQEDLMYCRIIGHFFHNVPTGDGLVHLAQEVISAKEDKQTLLDIGKFYLDHALRVFRASKVRTPALSDYPSRPSVGGLTELIKVKLEEAPQSHQTAKNRALVRDGFKCLISGRYDGKSAMKSEELMQKAGGNLGGTQCAHIFSESTNVNVGVGSNRAEYAASAWAVLGRFGGRQNLVHELNGSQVHQLENVMTLEYFVHTLFDKLDLWLEPTGAADEYKETYNVGHNPALRGIYPEQVEFTTTDPIKLPLPSREYLALHAACAKVAYLSGAAEYLDSIFRDMEEMKVLSKDGTSAAVLEHAIWTAQGKLISV